jgi:hypothetical protein
MEITMQRITPNEWDKDFIYKNKLVKYAYYDKRYKEVFIFGTDDKLIDKLKAYYNDKRNYVISWKSLVRRFGDKNENIKRKR